MAAQTLIRSLGSDIRRALPGSIESGDSATTPATQSAIPIYGRVQAGQPIIAEQILEEVQWQPGDWRNVSGYWPITYGEVIHIRVVGDSMEPGFSEGEIIACRKPRAPRQIGPRTPCIVRIHEHDMTFKLVSWVKHRRLKDYLQTEPLNTEYEVETYHASEVAIDYIVLGSLRAFAPRTRYHASPNVLREEPAAEKPNDRVVINQEEKEKKTPRRRKR